MVSVITGDIMTNSVLTASVEHAIPLGMLSMIVQLNIFPPHSCLLSLDVSNSILGRGLVIVKDVRALLLYSNRPILKVTWMGNTHEETDVLPSNGLNEDSFKEGGHLRQDFSYSQRDSQHKVNPFRQRARQAERMRLDCNAAQQRYSLRLVIQDNIVFILS